MLIGSFSMSDMYLSKVNLKCWRINLCLYYKTKVGSSKVCLESLSNHGCPIHWSKVVLTGYGVCLIHHRVSYWICLNRFNIYGYLAVDNFGNTLVFFVLLLWLSLVSLWSVQVFFCEYRVVCLAVTLLFLSLGLLLTLVCFRLQLL